MMPNEIVWLRSSLARCGHGSLKVRAEQWCVTNMAVNAH